MVYFQQKNFPFQVNNAIKPCVEVVWTPLYRGVCYWHFIYLWISEILRWLHDNFAVDQWSRLLAMACNCRVCLTHCNTPNILLKNCFCFLFELLTCSTEFWPAEVLLDRHHATRYSGRRPRLSTCCLCGNFHNSHTGAKAEGMFERQANEILKSTHTHMQTQTLFPTPCKQKRKRLAVNLKAE